MIGVILKNAAWENVVLEGILYFALGFLSATMLALMISPAIWSRAVDLTRKQVESSVPLTLNEIQADKDQLRAEFAMSTRRLEMSVDELREKAARQVIEISRKRDELAQLAEESQRRISTIEELEHRGAELRDKLRDREEHLAAANQRLEESQLRLEEKAHELEELRSEISSTRSDADSARIELVAKHTRMENLADQVGDVERRENALKEEIGRLRGETMDLRIARDAGAAKVAALEATIQDLRTRLEGSEDALNRRELELSRSRATTGADQKTLAELNEELLNEKSRSVELEAKLAQSALQLEALLNDASNDNVEKAMESLNKDKEALEGRLAEVTEERDRLRQDLSHLERNTNEDWESERRENAILRERINDLAAKVTAMTAALEGNESAINSILETAPAVKPRLDFSPSVVTEDDAPPAQKTLAERIRALQETVRQAKSV